MLMSKRADLGGFVVLFWAMVVTMIILVFFTLGASLIKTFSDKDVGVGTLEVLDINDYMENFDNFVEGRTFSVILNEDDICIVDSVNRVLNGPCLCPTADDLLSMESGVEVDLFDCLMNHYCYYGEKGCSVINENLL